MDDLNLWHFSYWDEFSDMTYSSTLNKSHLTGRGDEKHKDELFEITDSGISHVYEFENPLDHKFYEMQKENKNYLLPYRYYVDLPMIPTQWIDMKYKDSDKKVWRFIQEYQCFKIPEKKTGTLKEFVQRFNPLRNSNPDSATTLKLISLCRGIKIAVCGDFGVGKNAHYHIKSSIQNDAFSGLKNCSEAFFHNVCVFNNDINIDEITTWTTTKIQAIEDKLAAYGDQSTKSHKHALDNNKSHEMIKNITDKSFVITFNPYHEKDHPKYFGENMGNPGKIKDRFPFIYVQGKTLDSIQNPSAGSQNEVVVANINFYRDIASEYMYWRNHYMEHVHGYDCSALNFKGRKLTNVMPLVNMYDVMSDSKAEFDYWISYLNKCSDDYHKMESGRFIRDVPVKTTFDNFIVEEERIEDM